MQKLLSLNMTIQIKCGCRLNGSRCACFSGLAGNGSPSGTRNHKRRKGSVPAGPEVGFKPVQPRRRPCFHHSCTRFLAGLMRKRIDCLRDWTGSRKGRVWWADNGQRLVGRSGWTACRSGQVSMHQPLRFRALILEST
jgi:hypothetical protein